MRREQVHAEPIAGVVLAGGLSRRMGGGDKCLRLLSGAPLLRHALQRIHPQVDAVVLNANGDPARFQQFGVPVVEDAFPGYAGPLAGVLAGMAWAGKNFPEARYIATAACDTPFFPRTMVGALYDAVVASGAKLAVAASLGRSHPTFGLWSVELAGRLEEALAAGRRKLLACVAEHNGVLVDFAPLRSEGADVDPFLNVNTPEELAQAEQLWRGVVCRY